MNPYQIYSNNNFPQYQQPMYQPLQNPYMDRMSQMQSMQPQMNTMQMQQVYSNLSGRIVDDFSVITANDVPMDGNGAIFVKRDGSEIQLRNWTAQGTIRTSVFKPALNEQADTLMTNNDNGYKPVLEELTGIFQGYFDEINKRFDKLEQSIVPLD